MAVDLATLETWLTQAQTAYQALLTGTKTVEVQHGDMRQKFTEANAAALKAWIEDLKSQIAALGGSTSTALRRRAMEVNLGGL